MTSGSERRRPLVRSLSLVCLALLGAIVFAGHTRLGGALGLYQLAMPQGHTFELFALGVIAALWCSPLLAQPTERVARWVLRDIISDPATGERPPPLTPARRARLVGLLWALGLLAAGLAYLFWTEASEWSLYQEVKGHSKDHARFRGRLFRVDSELGYAPTSDVAGTMLFPDREIPVRHDSNGFRAPEGAAARAADVLFLGCSFTYGYGVATKDTFVELAGAAAKRDVANGGACGWGIAQMLLCARHKVPALKPRIVVAEAASWLIDRSQRKSLSSAVITTFTLPYFTGAGEGLAIAPPCYAMMDFDPTPWTDTPSSFLDYESFVFRTGVRLRLENDLGGLRLGLSGPAPSTDREGIVRYSYGELAKLAEAQGGRLVVLLLDRVEGAPEATRVLRSQLEALRCRIVDATATGRPECAIPIDGHPNERGHAEIARALIESGALDRP
jgi:hypothetical protein